MSMKPLEIKETLKAVIGKGVKCPIIIRGEAGIGKSQVVAQAARELGFNLIDLRLAQQEAGDLIGLPRTNPETKKTVWYVPEWWPKEGEKTIIFLDELNRAPVDVRQAIFQLLTEYRMHTAVLPKETYLVAAINPDGGSKMNYQVEQFDPAMVNRMCFINMEADVQQWVNWATENELDELVIKFIAVQGGSMLYAGNDTGPFPSPRSWHKLSDLRKASAIPTTAESEIIGGLVGDKASVAFIRFMDKSYKKPIGGREILDDFAKVKDKILKQRNDENFATSTELVGVLGDGQKLTKKQMQNVIDYALCIKEEEKMSLLKKLPNALLSKMGNMSPEICNAVCAIAAEIETDRTGKKSK